LQGQSITLAIDKTGDHKKGKTTDYVDRQYIGDLGKIDNGIVSVNAYGHVGQLTFPLLFKVFKPKQQLKEDDEYQTKLQLAQTIMASECLKMKNLTTATGNASSGSSQLENRKNATSKKLSLVGG
jgi:SRSO17 transposase